MALSAGGEYTMIGLNSVWSLAESSKLHYRNSMRKHEIKGEEDVFVACHKRKITTLHGERGENVRVVAVRHPLQLRGHYNLDEFLRETFFSVRIQDALELLQIVAREAVGLGGRGCMIHLVVIGKRWMDGREQQRGFLTLFRRHLGFYVHNLLETNLKCSK